jgi:hypothetical protein
MSYRATLLHEEMSLGTLGHRAYPTHSTVSRSFAHAVGGLRQQRAVQWIEGRVESARSPQPLLEAGGPINAMLKAEFRQHAGQYRDWYRLVVVTG